MSAIVGRKEVMAAVQGTFISSTFYTERIGFAAALRNIEEYQKRRVWEKQISYGQRVKAGWKRLADEYELPVEISGIDPLAHFSFVVDDFLGYKTFITQEMLKKGYLASNAFYASFAHSEEIIDAYLEALRNVFSKIQSIRAKGDDIKNYLTGSVCQAGFQRLN